MNTKQMIQIARLAAFVLGAGFTLDAAAANTNFAPEQAFGAGNMPLSVASADFNGDGMPDLVSVNWTDGTISVLMNTATPGAAAPSYADQQTFAVGSAPSFVTTADLDGDGKPDIIVLSANSDTLTVLINTTPTGAAQASFAAPLTYAVGMFPESVAVADVNGDSLPDLVVANYGDYTLSVLLNTTTGGVASFMAPQTVQAEGGPYSLQTVDLNGDGLPDVVVSEMDTGAVSVLLNTTVPGPAASTTVSFAPQQDYPVGDFPESVAVADLNGDGLPDIVVGNMGDNTISVLFNITQSGDPAPSFGAQQVIPVGTTPQAVAAADINNDGIPDVLVLNFGDNDVMTLTNATAQGADAFSFSQQTFATGNEPYGFVIIDENMDGLPDVVTANGMDYTLSVLLNAAN